MRGSVDDGEFTIFYLDGDRLAAALTVGRSDDLERARELIASREPVDRDEASRRLSERGWPTLRRRAATASLSRSAQTSAASSRLRASCSTGKPRARKTFASHVMLRSRLAKPLTSSAAQLTQCAVSCSSQSRAAVAVALEVARELGEIAVGDLLEQRRERDAALVERDRRRRGRAGRPARGGHSATTS